MNEFKYKNLVFEGNGAVGIAYVGSVKAMDEYGIYSQIESVCGASSGSLISLLVSLNYSPDEIAEVYNDVDMKKILDPGYLGLFRLISNYGFCKGDYLEDFCRKIIEKKTGNPNTKFRDLQKNNNFRNLSVITTNLSLAKSEVFSCESTPDFDIAKAIRMSFSIPLVFSAKQHNGNFYVDGGVLQSYGIEHFDESSENSDDKKNKTLGFYLNQRSTYEVSRAKNIFEFIKNLIMVTVIYQQYDSAFRSKNNVERTVFIDSLGISPLDFSLDSDQKEKLIDRGYEDTKNYLNEVLEDDDNINKKIA